MKTTKKFSFVVPVSPNHTKYLKRCLHSIIAQDYKNWEIVVVFDGENPNGVTICKELERKGYNLIHIEYKEKDHGAPWTRNRGFEKTTGDYVSYFDADCVLVPGGLRTWAMAFEDNPWAAFVYGGYRWNLPSLDAYVSHEFDEYLLTVGNYISGLFPMKREYAVGWREGLKSSQDWDMWLRIVAKGGKGKFIRDITVVTEPSYANTSAITADGFKHWLERQRLVKELNGLPDRKLCVASLGAPLKGVHRAKVLSADYKSMPSDKEHTYEMILLQGFYMRTPDMWESHLKVFMGSSEKCKRVVQWLGSDVRDLSNLPYRQNREAVKFLTNKKFINKHICNAPWLEEELKEMGVDAETVYAPLDINEFPAVPLPKDFTVGIYFTDAQPEVYYLKHLVNVARNMPDVRFLFFGGYGNYFPQAKNMRYCGFEKDMKELIKECSMLIRITSHDGFPMSPVEFLVSGRQVIINRPTEFMNSIKLSPSKDSNEWANQRTDLIRLIRTLKDKPLSKKVINKARAFYKKLLSPDTYRRKIYAIYSNKK